jgi:endonuclease III
VTRFLRPLRARWPAAAELPLAPAAHAAARHLGWIDASDDPESEPTALRRALAELGVTPSFGDVESALERLGRRACMRERADRCPMETICPLVAARERAD